MAELPSSPDLDQLRRQAKELLRGAQQGDATAHARIGVVSDRLDLSAAQLALAREYVDKSGFDEVEAILKPLTLKHA